MTIISKRIVASLAGVVLLASIAAPAYTADVGAGVSVGGANGVNGGLGGSVGRSVGAGLGVSIGGAGGANAGAGASLDGEANPSGGADVSVGGAGGVNLGLWPGARQNPVSTSASSRAARDVSGNTASIGPRASDPDSGAIGRQSLSGLSDKEIARYKRRCNEVLADAGGYDDDLVSLQRGQGHALSGSFIEKGGRRLRRPPFAMSRAECRVGKADLVPDFQSQTGFDHPEIAIIVEERHAVLDTPRSDNDVDRAANGYTRASKRTVVCGSDWRDLRTAKSNNRKAIHSGCDQTQLRAWRQALQKFDQDEIADGDLILGYRSF